MKNKSDLWLVLVIVVLLFWGIFTYVNFGTKKIDTSDIIGKSKVYGKCPSEFNKEVVNIMARDFLTSFPQNLESIYAEDYAQGKGNFSGYCRQGLRSGENINWVYCDSDGEGIYYRQNSNVTSDGFIQAGGKWNVEIIFDSKTCQRYSPESLGKIMPPLYKCNITELRCS
jgi:hypothetical protein